MSATDELQRLCAEGGSHTRIKYLRSKIKRATIAELRKLLRERDVRFNEFKLMTQWAGALGESVEAYPTDTFPDTLLVKHAYLTPAQAIAATLGNRTDLSKRLREVYGLHAFAGLFGFDWTDGSDWDWHDVACAMADAVDAATVRTGTCHEIEDEDTGFIVCSECGAVHDESYTAYYCWCCGRRIEQ